jgi:nucleoside-diphosphate-sugar epimerase
METLAPEGCRSLILLTGATGYIGGRLLKALEAAGRRVRCLTWRTPRPDNESARAGDLEGAARKFYSRAYIGRVEAPARQGVLL